MKNDDNLSEEMDNFCPSDHEFPLHYVLSLDKHYYLLLFDKIKDKYDINAKDHSGNTPLHIVALYCEYSERYKTDSLINEIIRLGADINAINKNGDTPIHILLRKNPNPFTTACNFIAKYKPKLDIKNNNNESPFILACINGKDNSLEKMLQQNVNEYFSDYMRLFPIHWAVLSKSESSPCVLKYLICHNNNINLQCSEGNTALHYLFSEEIPIEGTLVQVKKYFMLLFAGIDERITNIKGIKAKPIEGSAIERFIYCYKDQINLIRQEVRSQYFSPELSMVPICGEVVLNNLCNNNIKEGIEELSIPLTLQQYLIDRHTERSNYLISKLNNVDYNGIASSKKVTINFIDCQRFYVRHIIDKKDPSKLNWLRNHPISFRSKK